MVVVRAAPVYGCSRAIQLLVREKLVWGFQLRQFSCAVIRCPGLAQKRFALASDEIKIATFHSELDGGMLFLPIGSFCPFAFTLAWRWRKTLKAGFGFAGPLAMAYTRRLLSGFPALVEKNSGFPATANAQK
jgi:hypothetical protein